MPTTSERAAVNLQLGKAGRTPVRLDLPTLLDTRMLVTGSSGSGKSWLLRLIAEQSAPRVPVLILDPEGEYGTLREKLDLVLVGEEGDIRPSVAAAPTIARKLFDLGVSAVIDLYALKLDERRDFVRGFIGALMAAPRSTWHPCLVLLDEAHRFCPERGGGTSSATDAVITLLSQGRKRGLGTVLATQRLSKLHKDAAAEATNVLVGRTTLDVDVARARDLLGLSKQDGQKLRSMQPGQWHSFGPAFSPDGVTLFRSAKVETSHPEAGKRHLQRPPAPSKKLRRVLSELAELADRDTPSDPLTLEDARAEVGRLRQQLANVRPDPDAIKKAVDAAVSRERAAQHRQLAELSTKLRELAQTIRPEARAAEPSPTPTPPSTASPPRPSKRQAPPAPAESRVGTGGVQRMLTVLVQHPDGCDRTQLAILAGLSSKSGTFSTYLGRLRTSGWVCAEGAHLVATPDGIEALGDCPPLPSGEALVAYWLDWCGRQGGRRRMLQALIDAGPQGMKRNDLASAADLSPNSGTFSTYLGKLRSAKLIDGRERLVAAAPLLDAARR